MTNTYFGQLRAGVRPIDKRHWRRPFLMLPRISIPASGLGTAEEYGYEIDLTVQPTRLPTTCPICWAAVTG